MRTFFILAVCLCVCVCSAGEKEKLAEEYLVAKGTPELLDSTINGMVEKHHLSYFGRSSVYRCRRLSCHYITD